MNRPTADPGQRGGAALLVAFSLVLLLAAGGLGVSRNLLRELALCGDAARGAEAAAAADSGLDWWLAWAAEPAGRAFLAGLEPGSEAEAPVPPDQGFRVRVRHLGSWPPGEPDEPAPEPTGEPSIEPATEPAAAPAPLWLVTAVGTCRRGPRSPAGSGFAQARQAYAIRPPGPDGDRGPRLLAWLSLAGGPAQAGWEEPTSATWR